MGGGDGGGIFYKNGGGWQKARMPDFFYCIDHKADTAVLLISAKLVIVSFLLELYPSSIMWVLEMSVVWKQPF